LSSKKNKYIIRPLLSPPGLSLMRRRPRFAISMRSKVQKNLKVLLFQQARRVLPIQLIQSISQDWLFQP